jgi:signal transduction histidine kinase
VKKLPAATQITIKDNGSGIHTEDIHHIFKRFYRSRFSKDTQGIGLDCRLQKQS